MAENHTRNTQRKKDMNQIIYANSLNKELISLLPMQVFAKSREQSSQCCSVAFILKLGALAKKLFHKKIMHVKCSMYS